MYNQGGGQVAHHLARTSPIPTDPVYHNYNYSSPPKSAPPARRSPIPKDPTYANASGRIFGRLI